MIRRYVWVSALLLAALPSHAQLLSVGVKGGVPLADPLSTSFGGSGSASHTVKRYIVGATGELRLPFGLSIEVDALYRRLGYNLAGSTVTVLPGRLSGPNYFNTSVTGNDWQFPLLAKYRFRKGVLLRPFADAGVSFRHVSLSNASLSNPNTAGFTIGGGLEFKLLFLRLSPEFRYSYFPTEIFGVQSNYVRSNSNQADFLVGLTF